jgi:hypothetical protein
LPEAILSASSYSQPTNQIFFRYFDYSFSISHRSKGLTIFVNTLKNAFACFFLHKEDWLNIPNRK